MENFQTDVYISGKAGTDGADSQVGGLYGIFDEFDAYVTEVQSTVGLAPRSRLAGDAFLIGPATGRRR